MLLISCLSLSLAQADIVRTCPYQGLTYIKRTETSPRPLAMHIILIDLSASGIAFKLTPPGGTRETLKQTTLDFLNQENAQAAINAHFFLPTRSNETNANVIGLAASQGIIYSPFEPQPLGTDYVDQSYAILPYAPALNIDPFNRPSIVHLDPAYPDNQHVLEPVTLWNSLSGSAQIISDGVKTIPTYSGSPSGLNPLNNYSDTNSWYAELRARTVIGFTRDGEQLVLFTVDEAGGSQGMTVGEVADLLIADYQIYEALNLDGDGSTTMVLQDPVTHVGRIVNNASFPFNGRVIASSLALFAQPRTAPTISLTLTTTLTNSVILSWPGPESGWRLQQNPGLDPANWTQVGGTPQCLGGRMESVLEVNARGRFYRLTK